MRYSNPRVAKITSATASSENREFLRLLISVVGITLVLAVILDRLAYWAVPRLPFSWEVEVAHTLKLDRLPVNLMAPGAVENQETRRIEAALQVRVDRIVRMLDVPPEFTIKAHYVRSPVVNAVATLGGHVTVFSGLLDKLEYEEELDAVLAHEVGHVIHRDMMRQLSRGVAMAATLGVVGIRSRQLNSWLIGDAQQLQQLAYTRAAERDADESAILVANRLYGHTGGLVVLFQRFRALQEKQGAGRSTLAFLQSHPQPSDRAERALGAMAGTTSKPMTPLDKIYSSGKH
jgi:beta-barrel assembly-enhancing protease